ncbi:DNA repair metallo-beta-lactamase-domain-containing protein [Crassisporium funariophilum]|nr:DNA repair metallo-beta-lactamase-domain-containing protein [Crassisporium funariophilum]
MPPGKQKLKTGNSLTPGRTLHDFFDPKAHISPSQKKPWKTNSSEGSKTSFRKSIQHEIIVIESDSDEPEIVEPPKPMKRRRLSSRNTETGASRIRGESSLELKAQKVESHSQSTSDLKENLVSELAEDEPILFGSPVLLLSSASINGACIEPPVLPAFGQPSSLLPVNSIRRLSGKSPTDGQEFSSTCLAFGQPSSLLLLDRSRKTLSETPIETGEGSPIAQFEEVDVDIDLTLDDWQNGDDEQLFDFKAEDDDSTEDHAFAQGQENPPNEPDEKVDSSDVEIMDQGDDFESFSHRTEPQPALTDQSSKQLDPSTSISRSTRMGPQELVSCDGKRKANGSNAFSVLMSSFKENEAWKEATVAEDRTFRATVAKRRKAPFYKIMQGMPIAVDAFKYGAIPNVNAYFLTHAHSDHYTNLSSSWKNGPIYCSEGTANLIVHMLSVDRKWVHPLPMDTPTLIPNTNGVSVTLIEANHCPGSCLFFFEGPQTINAGDSNFKSHFVGSSKIFRYLHCGDFRASPRHILHPAVYGKLIDHVYLDTTYLDPKYTFPPQPLVISACAELAKRLVLDQPLQLKKSTMESWMSVAKGKGKDKEHSPKLLVVVGTYSIGKERIVKAIANALNSKVYCDSRKSAILKCQADPELDLLLTANPMDAIVHVVPLSTITTDRLQIYLNRFKDSYDKVIGFRPTGWTYTQPAGTNQLPTVASILSRSSQKDFTYADLQRSAKSPSSILLYGVPYSEHSSFYELTCFAMSFNWTKMIATVNVGSESSRAKMAKWVAKWEAERKKRGKDVIVEHRRPDYW